MEIKGSLILRSTHNVVVAKASSKQSLSTSQPTARGSTNSLPFQGLLQGRRRGLPRVRRDEVGVVPRGGEVEGGPGLEGAAARRAAHPLHPPRKQERHGRILARKSNKET